MRHSNRVSATAMAAALLWGGGAFASDWAEAPLLTERVEAGSLPPVVERLPVTPEVVSGIEGIGKYGGDLRFGLRGSSDHNHILRMVSPHGLVRWNPDYSAVVPNVAESFEANEDATEFTFTLREGMRWSDGTPFTADDILFNVNDLLLNADYAPTPQRYQSGGEQMSVEKIDDYTVRFSFVAPYGDFLAELSSPLGQHPVLYAKHYCQQFHPNYTDDINAVIAEFGASDWRNLFQQKCGDIEIPSRWANPDRPTLDPWVVTEPYTGGATRVVMERNPFFWQVDEAGHQLPYIDRLVAPIAQDVESLILQIIGGRIDFAHRHVDAPANRPVLAENRAAGDYDFFEARAVGGANMVINLNLAHKDPEMRALFNERDFRVALSLGMDRDEVIATALLGEGEPWQGGPFRDHPNFHERLATQYLNHDPAEANRLLDELGFERGSDGIRRMPNGQPVRFSIDVIPTLYPEHVDMLEMISAQWAEIGVRADVNPIERTFFFERTSNSNDHDAAVWSAAIAFVPGEIPQQIVPVHHDSRWGIPWSRWYNTGGAEGEEPPESVKERMRLYDQAKATVDQDERRAIMHQIADIAADEFEVMSVATAPSTLGIRQNDLRNVPSSMPQSWFYPTPGPALPQVWFWDR